MGRQKIEYEKKLEIVRNYLSGKIGREESIPVPVSLILLRYSEILYFQYALTFVCDDAFALYNAIIFKNKHRSSVEVKINHVFLLVCQQEQGKIP